VREREGGCREHAWVYSNANQGLCMVAAVNRTCDDHTTRVIP
jgi:hypothetical protein